jgi:hypothetical protein
LCVCVCVCKVNGNLHFTLTTFIFTVDMKWYIFFLAVCSVYGLLQAYKEYVVN